MKHELTESIKNMIRDEIRNMHTAMPGRIVAFDSTTGLATVEPVMRFTAPNGDKFPYPQISGVPVLFPQGNKQNAAVLFPVGVGDDCLVIISEQSIDLWLYGQETETDLSFDLTNAICIPGLFAKPNPLVKTATDENAVIIKNGTQMIKVLPDEIRLIGKIVYSGTLESSET